MEKTCGTRKHKTHDRMTLTMSISYLLSSRRWRPRTKSFFNIQVDKNDQIKKSYGENASCKGAYEDFWDCITFDTTYKTNKHKMTLGVFVGVNHHLQSTIFVCALLRDESEDSFVRLFQYFLRCMKFEQPRVILTDQCPSMAKEIPRIFFLTLLKLCRWHILKKYREPLGFLDKTFENFKLEFRAIIN